MEMNYNFLYKNNNNKKNKTEKQKQYIQYLSEFGQNSSQTRSIAPPADRVSNKATGQYLNFVVFYKNNPSIG